MAAVAGLLTIAAPTPGAQASDETTPPQQAIATRSKTMKIRLTAGERSLTASLEDTPTARQFYAQLPLVLTLEDYAATEKIAPLPTKITTEGAPAGMDPDVGDITYYAPWGNLAIFYRDFGYASGLVPLGRIDSGIEWLATRGSLPVTIEAAVAD